jgi:hypothetical protein
MPETLSLWQQSGLMRGLRGEMLRSMVAGAIHAVPAGAPATGRSRMAVRQPPYCGTDAGHDL